MSNVYQCSCISYLIQLNLTLRGSSRHKQKVPIHSSDDGDDEGEGFKSGRYKGGQNKDESKLSKHQMKQKRKEERKVKEVMTCRSL